MTLFSLMLKVGKHKSFYLDLLKHESELVKITAAAKCLGLGIYIPDSKKTLA